MRTNNGNVKNTIVSIYFVLIVLAMVMATVSKSFRAISDNSTLRFLFITLGFAVLFFIVHFISRYFEYDSDGIKVVILNRGLLLSDQFNYREQKLEFDKNQLYAFKFRNYIIYKTLTIYLKNQRDKKTKKTFNVTLVTKKKRRYVGQSLSKIVKSNKN
ncbi:hypothetical protein SAMN04515667_2175 [Formosa sp. Hel1_31_208]|uniref:hypothetical protein n=1 Tax=Formosa sp. Hel1_31_208 TaxID=1798225 RepID=UPI00087B34A4|nr:hypothetical protein [Formosa sp. Hel1_31_208]SDS43667.1 hypothetical protein SAMN04515667_2175 [Formosa sp. Hel1_31_208]